MTHPLEGGIEGQRAYNRRMCWIVEHMAWLAHYLDSRPSDAKARALYARLEPWGA